MHEYINIRKKNNDPIDDEVTVIRILQEIKEKVNKCDGFITEFLKNKHFLQRFKNSNEVLSEDYKIKRMKQLNDIYDEVNKIKTDYCFKILEDYEEKTKQYKATQINIGEMTLR